MNRISSSLFVVIAIAAASSLSAQNQASTESQKQACGYTKQVLDPLIEEAEREQFHMRRVEIVGSTYTRYREFRKRMASDFDEGYIFTRASLEKSVRSIAKMNEIYPITMANIEMRLNRAETDLDIIICVIQKPTPRQGK